MVIVIDGIVYHSQVFGGISRIFTEILPRICDIDKSLKIVLFTEGNTIQNTPKHSQIIQKKLPDFNHYFRPRRIFAPLTKKLQSLLRTYVLGDGENAIWHSTYYSLPENWNGKTVVTVADMIFERFPKFFKGPETEIFIELKKQCIRSSDAVICISETTQKDVVKYCGVDKSKCHVIPLAYSGIFTKLDKLIVPDTFKQIGNFILYIGARVAYKNYKTLIKAYSKWQRKDEVALVLIGSPLTGEERRQLSKLNILDRVHCFSSIDDQKLNILYNLAEVFVYPSLYEGFGIPLLEAMACGCPVIASDIPSTVEIAGACPIYFSPLDIDSLLGAFEIAQSEGRNSERVKNGFKQVKLYSWDKTAQQTLKVYESLIGEVSS
jgi:glycosyltransferase involved in cell wall biosynthesis